MNKKIYNLTEPQKSILFTEQFYKGSTINNICGTAIINIALDFKVLEKTINIFIQNNDSFRLKLVLYENEMKQFKDDFSPFEIEVINLDSKDEISLLENEMLSKPFDIYGSSYLFNFKLFKFKDNTGGFVVNVHHLISDSWTFGLIAREVVHIYSCLIQNLPIENYRDYSYIDYIASEKEYVNSNKFQKDQSYWNDVFKTIPESASIPSTISNNTNDFSCLAKRSSFTINKNTIDEINSYCKLNNISVFNFFIAIYSLYISRVSSLDDFVIGTPILNRTNFKEKNTTGMFINIAPLRITINNSLNFKDFITQISKNSLSMLRHQKYSYQYILEDLRKKDITLPSLYNIVISYQITNAINEDNIPYETRWAFNGNCADDIDIHLYDVNNSGSIIAAYDYKIARYTSKEIADIHERIMYMIQQILNNPNINLNELEILSVNEKNEILYDFNNTSLKYDENIPLIKFFEAQVEKTPDATALTFEGTTMSYSSLNEHANSLAYELRENGVTNNSIVGVMVNRSFEMIIYILAVLKAGGAYIPIDPEYPIDRVNYMLEDSKARVLLTTRNINIETTNAKIIYADLGSPIYNANKSNLENISKPTDLSYIIYTSGSTGKPKGVMLTQKNFTNFYNAMLEKIEYLPIGKQYSIASITTLSFDIFGFETLISLTNGLNVYITNYFEQKITEKLEKLVSTNKIDIIQTTPSVMRFHLDNLTNRFNFSSLKYVILAGEQLPKNLVDRIKQIAPNCTIYNGYGPSETTIFSSLQNVTNLEEINIGKPIANTQIYILDNNMNILPKHHVGEIYISGDGVGNGYLGKPELTSKSFVQNPFNFNSLLYRTGDLGLWLDDGCIECKGRIDHQVKLHGLRIELGEIENKINSFSKDNCIKSAVIIKHENNKDYLCAFIESSINIDIAKLKLYLLKLLPNYMIPTYFTKIDKLPQTPNGKTDRKILQTYEISVEENKIVKPKTATEEKLFNLIADIIGNNDFSISSDLFTLGMDSLNIINLSSKIMKEFNVEISIKQMYNISSLTELAHLIDNSNISIKMHIEKATKKDLYPLSSAQKRIYFACKMNSKSILYNMPGYTKLVENIDINKLIECVNTLINKHEILRTYFVEKDGDVFQAILDNVILPITHKNGTLDDIEAFVKPFNLQKAPLFKMEFLHTENGIYLLFDMHHIIGDGLSLNLFIRELFDLYNDKILPENSISYVDYSEWDNASLTNNTLKKDEEYWLNELSDLPVLNMPLDFPRPTKQTFKGDKLYKHIDSETFRKLQDFCNSNNITPYMFLLSCYTILLSKYCMQEEIVVGSPIANRIAGETDTVLGMFVNNIVLKAIANKDMPLATFFNNIKETVVNAFEHCTYPFNQLVNKLNIKRSTSRNPIFDTMFIYQNEYETATKFNTINTHTAKFDLSFEIIPNENGASINIEYCADLFNASSINSLAQGFLEIISDILQNSDKTIGEVNVISDEQKDIILNKFNNTKTNYPNTATIAELFEEQVLKNPEKTAVVFEDTRFTYAELNKKSNQLAYYLKSLGVGREDIVCILLDKSMEMIVAILAILKAGAAYLPIDVYYPKDRIDYIIRDSKSKILLTDLNFVDKSNSTINSICIDLSNQNIYDNNTNINNIENINTASDLAYIMYTSGSTGNPKGTMIEQKSVVRLVKNTNFIQFGENEHILQTGSIVFDACTFEIWAALLNGFELYIIKKDDLLDANKLQDYLIKNKITILWLTAPLFNQLSEENPHMFNQVKYLLTGGDVLSPKHINMVKTANPNLTIINGYGPTENTTFSCCFTINKQYDNNIPVGYPIANSTAYVVSSSGKLLPAGFAGELWVGGDGVARGYLNNPELSVQKFIDNPYDTGKLYKTGDLVRFSPEGYVEFFGRIDSQVKIRGFRVELNEINLKLAQYNASQNNYAIKECATVVHNINDEKTICSYFVSDVQIDINDLKTYLKTVLPVYMLPTYFMQLEKLPLNTNGKIDKKALTTNFKIVKHSNNIIEPSNKEEEILLNIFKKILNFDDIGVTDNFFDLGGDSLGAMKIQIEALSNELTINYADIFKYPTVRELAKCANSEHITASNNEIDYSKYDKLLSSNVISEDVKLDYTSMGNVLLTGFTGFLGAHILDSFIKKESGDIYCLIRSKNNMTAMDRLENVLHFYFKDKYDKYIGNRIRLVEGDITFEHLGLNDTDYTNLGHTITTVIHSAAMVKHYGNFKDFEAVNINGTNEVLNFCKNFNLRLMHISTISVSGNALAEQSNVEQAFTEDKNFDETNFYIGQNIENLYIKSKFEAEKLVLDAIMEGLPAYILRMGNLTSRFSEGKFQQNHFENAFVNRFKSILQIGYAPDYLLKTYTEFTPIDYCGDAIIDLASHYNKAYSVFHLLNEKQVTMTRLFDMLSNLGISLKIVSSDEFVNIINQLLKDENKKSYLEGIVNDLNKDKKLVYESNIKIKSDFSTAILEKIGFRWPYIDSRYIHNYLKYLADIGYFNIKID